MGPVEEEHPAADKAGLFAQEFAAVGDKAAGRGAVHHQLAQRPEDEKAEKAACAIDQRQRRSRGLQPGAGAQEKPCADGAANGDHLDLARLQRLVVPRVMGFQPFLLGKGLSVIALVRHGPTLMRVAGTIEYHP